MQHTEAPLEYIEEYYDILDTDEKDQLPEILFEHRFVKQIKGKSILSIGCGPNFFDDALLFKELPKEYVGIDLNKNTIKFLKDSRNSKLLKAKKRLEDNGTKITLLTGDIFKFNEEWINKFDAIVAIGVLSNFNEKQYLRLLDYFKKYLKKDGMFLDVGWRKPYLDKKELDKKLIYKFYFETEIPSQKFIDMIKNNFIVLDSGIHIVEDPKDYLWGELYGCIAVKK